jgi:glycosyltransferase involved in cell wall biosynthesis
MKIAIVALTDFQDFPTGGILTFVRRFVEAVGARPNLETTLVGWSPRETPAGAAMERVRIGPAEHHFLAVGNGRLHGVLPDRVQFYMNRRRWDQVLGELRGVEAYYCHSPEAVLRVARSRHRRPIALHLHGAINSVGRSRFALGRMRPVTNAYEALVLRPALRLCDAVFATVSDSEFGDLSRRGLVSVGVPCKRVPAMVSRRGNPREGTPSQRLRLVCVGRLERIKGIDLIIQSVAALVGRGRECTLDVIGDGSERGRLERLVARLNLERAVSFKGTLSEAGVQQALQESDIFVSGSHQEGFSLALLEALAQGLPAVVTDVGSARDVVRDGVTGYVVDRRDASVLADRVLAAAAQRQEMSSRCRAVAEPYSSGAVSGVIVDTLEAIASRSTDRLAPVNTPTLSQVAR